MNYKGIDKEKILEVQKVKLLNADAYVRFTEEELKNICSCTDSFERIHKQIEQQHKARMNDTEMAIICEMAMKYLDEFKAMNDNKTEAYSKGLNDAWELARKIAMEESNGGFSSYDILNIFGYGDMDAIFMCYSPQEALAKFETYEKEQAEIKVGDVVIPKVGKYREKEKGVVIGLYDKDDLLRISVIHKDKNGNIENTYYHKESLVKTGKHIDIQKILDELEEGNDNA